MAGGGADGRGAHRLHADDVVAAEHRVHHGAPGQEREPPRREHVHQPAAEGGAGDGARQPARDVGRRTRARPASRSCSSSATSTRPSRRPPKRCMMIARDLTIGSRKQLLQNQIVIIAPIFNVDGTDTFVTAERIARQRDAAHLRHARERRGTRPQSRRGEARDGRSERDVPAAERVGSGAAARRPPDEPRDPRLREHLWHDDGAGGRAGPARLHARHAVPGRARHGPQAVRPRGVHARALHAQHLAADRRGATTAPPGRSKRSSSSTTTGFGTGSRSSPRRPVSRRSSGASTRSTPTSPRCSSTPTRTRRRCRRS